MGAQKKTHMGRAAQSLSQVVAQGAHIKALGAAHGQQRPVTIGHLAQLQPMHCYGPLGNIRLHTLTGQLVQRLAVLLQGAEHGRPLQQFPGKPGQNVQQCLLIRIGLSPFHRLSLSVLGGGGASEGHFRYIGLFLVLHVVE